MNASAASRRQAAVELAAKRHCEPARAAALLSCIEACRAASTQQRFRAPRSGESGLPAGLEPTAAVVVEYAGLRSRRASQLSAVRRADVPRCCLRRPELLAAVKRRASIKPRRLRPPLRAAPRRWLHPSAMPRTQ